MLAAGFQITGVHPGSSGTATWYDYTSDLPGPEGGRRMVECREKYAPHHELSDAEVRTVYDRWVQERDCLVGLGYAPTSPPSPEKFLADWKTGPWMPIDGIDTGHWTDAQYTEAKSRCRLEMFDRS